MKKLWKALVTFLRSFCFTSFASTVGTFSTECTFPVFFYNVPCCFILLLDLAVTLAYCCILLRIVVYCYVLLCIVYYCVLCCCVLLFIVVYCCLLLRIVAIVVYCCVLLCIVAIVVYCFVLLCIVAYCCVLDSFTIFPIISQYLI